VDSSRWRGLLSAGLDGGDSPPRSGTQRQVAHGERLRRPRARPGDHRLARGVPIHPDPVLLVATSGFTAFAAIGAGVGLAPRSVEVTGQRRVAALWSSLTFGDIDTVAANFREGRLVIFQDASVAGSGGLRQAAGLLLVILGGACSEFQSPDPLVDAEVLARVGDDVVTVADYRSHFDRLPDQARSEVQAHRVLQAIIDEKLILAECHRLGLDKSVEIELKCLVDTFECLV